jgi:hypothetical protein
VSNARDLLNAMALKLLGNQVPPAEVPQPLQVVAPGAGGGGGDVERPIDWDSPDETHHLHAESDDASVRIILSDTCGSQIKIWIDADGVPAFRLIDCAGDGVKVTPEGITGVHVDDAGTEEESETEDDEWPGMITITGCVDGVDRSIRVLGYIVS